MRLGVLCSGGLGFALLKHLYANRSVSFVCTDSKSIDIVDYCSKKNLPFFLGNPRKGRINSFIEGMNIDVLISINYLFVIELNLIRLPKLLAFNVHGSLLPKYRGRTPHVWAIINNECVAGVTAHIIDQACDTGDIILQKEIPIEFEDTGATLLMKYEESYSGIIEEVLQRIEGGRVQLRKQDNAVATYFGKRTSADGLINWNWQRERIRNWVRAQAFPYPGAFTIHEQNKIIVDRVSFSDLGFNYDEPNGLIRSINPTLVKTPNGLMELTQIRTGNEFLEKGKILQS